jgi:hypothetical protein
MAVEGVHDVLKTYSLPFDLPAFDDPLKISLWDKRMSRRSSLPTVLAHSAASVSRPDALCVSGVSDELLA